ncbi:MAG: hypothetical protein ACXV3F_00930 [Frankiaceae bacterium]
MAFLQWAARYEIDYFVGRSIAPWLAKLGAHVIESNGQTAVYNGGRPFALWRQEGVAVIAETLMAEGAMTADKINAFMVACSDPLQWTMSVQFTQTIARKL